MVLRIRSRNALVAILLTSLHEYCVCSTFASLHRSSTHHVAAFAGTGVSADAKLRAKAHVLSVAERCNENSKAGVFLTNADDRRELKKAVAELEAVCSPPTARGPRLMLGDWKLLCTTNAGSLGVTLNDDAFDVSDGGESGKGPFGLPLPSIPASGSNPLQEKIRKSVEVTQRIRDTKREEHTAGDDEDTTIDRVDNVVEFTPFNISAVEGDGGEGGIVAGVTSLLSKLPLNPLEVTRSKVTLKHSAKVESISPVLRTRIALQSIILTVAGKSQYLNPDGADVLGLNVPLGEFLNAGAFDTTYVDEDIRISRGTIGVLDELRVFVRKGGKGNETGAIEEAVIQNQTASVSTVEALVDNTDEDVNKTATGDEASGSVNGDSK